MSNRETANLSDEELAALADTALQTLCKWRMVFTGWQLGTRAKGDPESDAVRDHRELTILLRAEVSAVTRSLIDAGVITQRSFTMALMEEAQTLNADYERKFPGFSASPLGIHIDPKRATKTTEGWRP